jgi:hypothetical protein
MAARLITATALVLLALGGCRGDRPADTYLELVDQFCACKERDCVDRMRAEIDSFDVSRFTGDDFDTLLEASTKVGRCVEGLGDLARPPVHGAAIEPARPLPVR